MENVKCKVEEKSGVARPHPFRRDELKKIIGCPQFRAGAKLVLTRLTGLTGLSVALPQTPNPDNLVNPVKDVSTSQRLCVKIPLADGNPESRVYAYEVTVTGDSDAANGVPPKFHKFVYASGCNVGIGHEPKTTTLEVMKSELPPGGVLTFSVRPVSSLGTAGKPIVEKFKVEILCHGVIPHGCEE